ncbi:diguanylate cyclase domain-containing protein [Ammoniphilus sp. YIM 78166]|uniref:bifunctional diguanylate cyclase/phosphohydrolase n=1 Tax=Ammoniphilus sp. YIM 78166 TaxID=1644106 RepID=UPI00106F776A|nr:diguanylate cyclase [Ammoniphilus sp. YIM 78166]
MTSPHYNELIFETELKVLERGKAHMENQNFIDHELRSQYEELLIHYEKLLKLSRKVFKISDAQGRELKKREAEIKSLLDNSSQGFLTFGENLLVHKEYSEECIRIFGQRIENKRITDLLCSDQLELKDKMAELLTSMFRQRFEEAQNQALSELPQILFIHNKSVSIEYKWMDNGEEADIMMVILTDVTDRLQSKAKLEYLSFHDSLTSLYNRAYVEKVLPQLMAPSFLPFSLVVVDMNGLKLTNDVFGHQKGDRLIVQVAQLLGSSCRSSDIISRWGGDEFLLLLPNTNETEAQALIDKIKENGKNMRTDSVEISVSLGAATKKQETMSFEELLQIAEARMYKNKLRESLDFRQRIMHNLRHLLDHQCYIADGHAQRVLHMALRFAGLTGVEPHSFEFKQLDLLARLHDIGKISIPKEILGKEGPLTDEEWEIMKSHSEVGYRVAQSIGEQDVAKAVLALHERWDGTGYPYGLSQDQIPFSARLVAIVNAFDVMTHDQVYKKKRSHGEALEEIERLAGTQFDPELARIFIDSSQEIISEKSS